MRLTASMRVIQEQIVALMDVCLGELKKSSSAMRGMDASELTVENALSRSFDYLLQRQLDVRSSQTTNRDAQPPQTNNHNSQ